MPPLAHSETSAAAGDFRNTRWSLVLAASQADSPEAQEALAKLCQDYWKPVYAFIRRRGHDVEPAKDLTQEFLSRLIQKQYLRIADRERGRFRTFLLACVEHFLHHEWRKERTLKRGGQYSFVPLEAALAEDRCGPEPMDEMSPDRLFDQRWALALPMEQLRKEYAQVGKAVQFEALQVFLSGAKEEPGGYSDLGARLGMTAGATRQAAYRLRCRFGELLRMGLAQTVAGPQELEAELIHLRAVLSNPNVGF